MSLRKYVYLSVDASTIGGMEALMHARITRLGIAIVALLTFPFAAVAAELVMVEEKGCIWCARWNTEIAPAYSKTDEGRFAPLRRVDINDMPEDLEIDRRVAFTPTFLLVEDGEELARIEGYPGADFFWPMLTKILTQNTEFAREKS
nr:hypothetical protein [Heliomarina baculiformis]